MAKWRIGESGKAMKYQQLKKHQRRRSVANRSIINGVIENESVSKSQLIRK
jgi:hypothetical protein